MANTPQYDRPLIGIALMLAFCILIPGADALSKLLSTTTPLVVIILVRFTFQFTLLVPFMWLRKAEWRMSGYVLRMTFYRSVLHVAGVGLMVLALKNLPLADAVAIAFVMPFIMLLLGKFFLNEAVGARRLIACTIGFIGTLLVIQPSFIAVGWPALYPLTVAFIFSFFMLVTRKIARDTDPIAIQAISGGMAALMMLPVALFFWMQAAPGMSMPELAGADWELLIALGILGTFAHLMMTWSLRYAPSTTLAPMQYLEIPFATLMGWFVFKELPNTLAAVGIAITLCAGLYIILREQAIARAQRLAQT